MKTKTYWDGMVETLVVLHRRDPETHARVLNEILCHPLRSAAKKSGKLKTSGIYGFERYTGRKGNSVIVQGNNSWH